MLHFATRNVPLRVLCVEEDEVQRKLLQACFDVADAQALFADSAARALWLFRRNRVDIVLMDIDLHAADELAAFEEMHATPHRKPLILAVTDNGCRWSEGDYREAGFDGLFLKPVVPTQLFAEVDRALRDAGRPPLLENANRNVGFDARLALAH
jgi:hypothetical protein